MDDNIKVIGMLRDLLINNNECSKNYYCLVFLCEKTLEVNVKGEGFQGKDRHSMKAYFDEQKGKPYKEASNINNFITEKQLVDYCARIVSQHAQKFQDLGFIPIIQATQTGGGQGNEKFFWLELKAIDDANFADFSSENNETNISEVNYRRVPAKDIKLAFYMKPFFKDGEMKNRSIKGLSFLLGWMLLSIGFIAVLIALAFSVTAFGNKYITFQILSFVMLGGCIFITIKYMSRPIMRLAFDRVIKAPELILSFKEYDAEIEMHRDFKEQRTRLTRFIATCPICTGEITLQKGEKHHLQPLVGKCSESPFIHVYSFDRALMTGKLLSDHVILKNNQ